MMDSWTLHYAICGIQVAFVVGSVYLLQFLLSRQAIGARVFVHTAGIFVVLAFSIAFIVPGASQFVPPPPRLLVEWPWNDSPSAEAVSSKGPTGANDRTKWHGERADAGIPLGHLLRLMSTRLHDSRLVSPRLAMGLRWILKGLILFAVLRLLFAVGWWQLLIVKSCKIDDPRLDQRLQRWSAQLGIQRSVALAEHSGIRTAATFGSWRPVVLLSSKWRTWSEADLAAVVAHELAHVRAFDYTCRLIAQVCVAVHFLNPLVRMLSASLQLGQESRADRRASALVGSERQYLAALARIALREDSYNMFKPAQGFLSFRSSHLMRRIDMLRSTEGHPSERIRYLQCTTIVAALLCIALLVAPLGAIAQQTERRAGSRVLRLTDGRSAPENIAEAKQTPFDISFIQPRNDGVAAIRVAKILGRPELERFVEFVRSDFAELSELIPPELAIGLEQVEQITGPLDIRFAPEKPAGERGQLAMGISYCRTTAPYDWVALVQAMSPSAKVVDEGERKRLTDVSIPALGPWTTYVVTDERSIACPSGFHGEEKSEAPSSPPQTEWPDAWDFVKQGDIACVFDNRDNAWGPSFDALCLRDDLKFARLWTYAAAAIEIGETVQLRVMLKGHDVDAANKIVLTAPEIIDELSRSIESNGTTLSQSIAAAIRDAVIRQQDTTVTVTIQSKTSASHLLRLLSDLVPTHVAGASDTTNVANSDTPLTETTRR